MSGQGRAERGGGGGGAAAAAAAGKNGHDGVSGAGGHNNNSSSRGVKGGGQQHRRGRNRDGQHGNSSEHDGPNDYRNHNFNERSNNNRGGQCNGDGGAQHRNNSMLYDSSSRTEDASRSDINTSPREDGGGNGHIGMHNDRFDQGIGGGMSDVGHDDGADNKGRDNGIHYHNKGAKKTSQNQSGTNCRHQNHSGRNGGRHHGQNAGRNNSDQYKTKGSRNEDGNNNGRGGGSDGNVGAKRKGGINEPGAGGGSNGPGRSGGVGVGRHYCPGSGDQRDGSFNTHKQHGSGGQGISDSRSITGGAGAARVGDNGKRVGGGGGGGGSAAAAKEDKQKIEPSQVQSVLTNIILAAPTPNFSFYFYTVHSADKEGKPIDSRQRRKQLFDSGLWDGILRTMSDADKKDLQRVVFFAGSCLYAGRPIPQLDAASMPVTLCNGSSTHGDVMQVLQVVHYATPTELRNDEVMSASALSASATTLSAAGCDLRCSQCTKAFTDAGALVQHCAYTGHVPVGGNESTTTSPPSNAGPIPAQLEVFTSYVNLALSRALSERFARWGHEYIDPQSWNEPTDDRTGKSLGVRVFKAYSCQFGVVRAPRPCLELTVDLRAKVVRTASVLDQLYDGRDPHSYCFSPKEQDDFRRMLKGEVVIYMAEKRCYSVVDLIFEHSPETLIVDGINMTHAAYFRERKNTMLQYPNCVPMVAVLGRRNQTIFLPPELVTVNDLNPHVKQQVPKIASFPPKVRNDGIENIRRFLIPGAQQTRRSSGLLPALGITLNNDRLSARAEVLAMPALCAAGLLPIPKDKGENWAQSLRDAKFNVNPTHVIHLNVVLICHNSIIPNAVYDTIRDRVNGFKTRYRFGDAPHCVIRSGNSDAQHWGAVENYLRGGKVPANVFVLDFTKPKQKLDAAYPVVKRILCSKGYLSQFVNFKTLNHNHVRDDKTKKSSNTILGNVARQILQKCGVRIWWVDIPKSLPLPALFVGVDVYHSPRVYDEDQNKRVGKSSCAAIIVQVIREGDETTRMDQIEMYAKTYMRESGEEFGLRKALESTISKAMRDLNVTKPASCIVWRDGISDNAFDHAMEEIKGIRSALAAAAAALSTPSPPLPQLDGDSSHSHQRDVPLSYIVCQKRIATKFFTENIPGHPDGKFGAPNGTLVQDIQSGLHHHHHRHYNSFYINGPPPPTYGTAKPVRFIVAQHDDDEGPLKELSIPHLTWQQCHEYPNWAGPIKVPSVCQLAHKLAELAGNFTDCGKSIDDDKLMNTIYWL